MASASNKELLSVVHTIRNRIQQARKQKRSLTEEDTKVTLITPLLRALGWNVEDFNEVRFEYRHQAQDLPVDYALFLMRTPTLFVEAKSLDTNLENHKWLTQSIAYASAVGVTWCVLTNGNEYRIYNAHAPVEATKKLFRSLELDETEDQNLVTTLELLSKANMGENTLNILWDAQFIDRQVKDNIEDLFNRQDAGLVRLIKRHTSGLTNSEINKSLQRANIQLDFPIPLALPTAEKREPPETPRKSVPSSPKPKPSGRVTLSDLITAGILVAPLELEKTFKKQHLSARVQPDGSVQFQGKTYHSLSAAAGHARNSVSGPPSDGRDFWQTNGWTFWNFRSASGELGEIDELRRKYLQRVLGT